MQNVGRKVQNVSTDLRPSPFPRGRWPKGPEGVLVSLCPYCYITHCYRLGSISTMLTPQQESVTRLLKALQDGDESALDHLFVQVYDELHSMAHNKRKNWIGKDYTLNTTALVHEAYMKLMEHSQHDWNSRAHFMGVAAKAMRHILINYAEKRRTKKRGGDLKKVSLEEERASIDDVIEMSDEQADKLLAIESAIKKLEKNNERQVRIIECKFFGGMTNDETAETLGISKATVKRDWAMAQAWLHREATQRLD
ncbi:MAG: sigma-70 family RNA polymerase sigma factor [Rhodothermaceae bacterium]|nr:sigma-70 family RNA polymerase sigma factor [Rhodothermaceae bacterium]